MRLGLPGLALIAASACFTVSVALAQDLPPPSPALAQPPFAVPPFKNLKVFPKDVSRADLLSNMKFFSQSLGVRCTYCHVGEEGKPLSTFDFASDAKDHKSIARDMIRADDSVILLHERQHDIVASVHLKRTGDACYLGMITVKPSP